MAAAYVKSAHGSSTASSNTIAATFGSAVAPDCDIEVSIVYDFSLDNTAHVTQVQDTLGNSYTLRDIKRSPSANGPAEEVWRAHSSSGGANTVTATISVAVPARLIAVHEISGLSSSPDDGANGGSSTSASTFTTNSIPVSQAGDFMFAGFGYDAGFGATITQVSPFVVRENFVASAGSWGCATATGVQDSAATITVSASAASPFAGSGISLKVPGPGGTLRLRRNSISMQQRS